jgi:hypothetical protein
VRLEHAKKNRNHRISSDVVHRASLEEHVGLIDEKNSAPSLSDVERVTEAGFEDVGVNTCERREVEVSDTRRERELFYDGGGKDARRKRIGW